MVFSAAESLARLEASQAVSALTRISQNHWYPGVRKTAMQAIQSIKDKIPYKSGSEDGNFALEFFAYENVGAGLEYVTEEDANSIRFPIISPLTESVEVPIKQMEGAVKKATLRGLPVEGGHLVGWDQGEFGGFLGFIDSKGSLKVIANENIEAVYRSDQCIYAIGGLAHLSMNSGAVYKIRRTPKGDWVAQKWRALPGAPRFSRLLKDGNLFVSCYDGIVLISPDGKMKLLTRAEAL